MTEPMYVSIISIPAYLNGVCINSEKSDIVENRYYNLVCRGRSMSDIIM